jgi:anti-sigma B factor antagonist
MQIKETDIEGVSLVEIQGEINISTSPELKKRFDTIKASKVIISMSNVDYVDSSGLATLVELLKKLKQKGGSLSLTQMSEKVKSLFEITKLDRLFGIYPSNEAALKNLK